MESPFKINKPKNLENIPLSQSDILFSESSSNNLTFNNPFQVKIESGAKVKKISGCETKIEPNAIELFDPLAQSAEFQDYSYKNYEVIIQPPIIETGNNQPINIMNTGNLDFLGEKIIETTNQKYENNNIDFNYIHSPPLEQYIPGKATDITNFEKETKSNSIQILPTIYADKNNISDILSQNFSLNVLKDNKDYSKPVFMKPERGIVIPRVDSFN